MNELCTVTGGHCGFSEGYERGRLLSWFLAIRFTFTKITISKINGTRYAIVQPTIPIPDIIIRNSFLRLIQERSTSFV
jgi:hypothetical protein